MSGRKYKPFLVRKDELSANRTRIFMGQYVIDLHQRLDATYYAISKTGSNDIVSMGHEKTYEDAEVSARWTVAQLENPEAFEYDPEAQSA